MDAIGALISADLPVFGVVAISGALIFFATTFVLFGRLVVAPRRYWLLVALVGLNVMILPALWSAGWTVSSEDPAIWARARAMVFVVSAVLLLPALAWWRRCRRQDAAEAADSGSRSGA